MESENKTTPNFSKYLFWDTKLSSIDFDQHARYVIERAVTMGQFSDWQEAKRYYGIDKIKECTLRSRNLDPRSLNFLSVIFNIPKEQFRWYTQRQSNPELWPY